MSGSPSSQAIGSEEEVAAASSVSPRFQGVFNFRDFGGCVTSDGRRVKTGLLYRCGMTKSTRGDIDSLAKLGVTTIVDLRSPDEQPNFESLLEGRFTHSIHNLLPHRALLFASVCLLDFLTAVKLIFFGLLCMWSRVFKIIYQTCMSAPVGWYYPFIINRGQDNVRNVFEVILACASASKPLVVCCSLGKDRTGFVCAVLLRALGAPLDAVIHDYCLSQNAEGPMRELLTEQLDALGLEFHEHTALPNPESVEKFLNQIDRQFGSIDGYLANIGFPKQSLDLLRQKLLQ
ncbi:tyrosine-protein phosphatase [Pelomyxa schiedti]|nr:tyrosine-protein phosphatase [Pelomyxa schiedti]